jgi:cobalt-zinc-cadmium efflux system membrane fusion protein
VVTHGDFGIGEVVEPSKQLIQIADLSRMWICLEVQKEQVHKLKVGQKVTFQGDGVPEVLVSEIAWISTEADESTRTLEVRASVENRIVHPEDPTATGQRLLRANTYGHGRILVRTNSDAIVVPTECIQSDGNNNLIFVNTGPTDFEGRVVVCGIEEGSYTEIEGPIAIGDMVVQQGSHILKSQVLLTRSGPATP